MSAVTFAGIQHVKKDKHNPVHVEDSSIRDSSPNV